MRRRLRDQRTAVVRLTGIKRVTSPSGKTYLYVRRSDGPDIRLPDLPTNDPDFLKAYTAAQEAPKRKRDMFKDGTIGAVFTAVIASEDMHTISPAYRAMIRRHADDIRSKYGAAPMRGLERRHIQQDVDASQAPDHRRKVWRWAVKWAIRNGVIPDDPTERVSLPRKATTGGHPAWTPEDVSQFRACWPIGSRQRLIMELLQWTGARISDAVLLGPANVGPDGVIAYRQQKTGGIAYCPWTCQLPAYAGAMEPDRAAMHLALRSRSIAHATSLATAQGGTRSAKSIGGVRQAAHEAGVKKSAHGLRKYRATQLAHAGATPHQIGAWTGHESLKEIARYTKSMDRRAAVLGASDACNFGKTSEFLPKRTK